LERKEAMDSAAVQRRMHTEHNEFVLKQIKEKK